MRGGSWPRGLRSSTSAAESTRPGAEPVDVEEELRRVLPVLEGLRGHPGLDRHVQGGGRAARRSSSGAEMVNDVTALRGDPEMGARRSRARRVCLPDAHAGGAADDADEPSVRRRRGRSVRVPRGADRVRDRLRDRRGANLRRSRHRLRQDSRPEPGARAPPRHVRGCSGARSSSGSRARARWARCWATRAPVRGRRQRPSEAAVAAFERGAWMLRAHDVRETVEALAVAAAVERGKVSA